MGQLLLLLVPILLSALGLKQYIGLHRNIKIAKTINLPYVIVPFYTGTIFWFIIAPVVIPLLRYGLPSRVNHTWIDLMSPFWTWYLEYAPFKALGSDTIVTVAPGGITFHTCSPEFLRQVGERRKDFQKPLELYDTLNTYGPNLVSTNGDLWRHQRKIMLPSFNDAHNVLVWSETIFQTKCMLQVLESELLTLPANKCLDFHHYLRMLTFNIIGRGTFGVRMNFPGFNVEGGGDESDEGGIHGTKLEGGHRMTFGAATLIVVEGLKWLFVCPGWLLRYVPCKFFNHIWLAYHEMGTYLDEYITDKQSVCTNSSAFEKGNETSNLLNSLIESKKESSSSSGLIGLTKQQIIGNVFNSLAAGHETTGTTLFYAMINLALHPAWQRRVQADIDIIFGGRDPSQWSYNEDLEKLFRSSLDATILETLRLYPPNNLIPKHSVDITGPPQTLKHPSGSEINVPANSRILILIASTHRNPNYWPHLPSSNTPSGTDMGEFRPERWFVTSPEAEAVSGRIIDLHPVFASQNSEYRLADKKGFFKPQRGAFIPWSIGNRECIGRKFAHTELLVALVMIFREWSVELDVDNFDLRGVEVLGEVERGGMLNEGMAWQKASEKAKRNLREGMSHYTTMQLGKGLVPLKIVRRKS